MLTLLHPVLALLLVTVVLAGLLLVLRLTLGTARKRPEHAAPVSIDLGARPRRGGVPRGEGGRTAGDSRRARVV